VENIASFRFCDSAPPILRCVFSNLRLIIHGIDEIEVVTVPELQFIPPTNLLCCCQSGNWSCQIHRVLHLCLVAGRIRFRSNVVNER
jgi:hypothetical protein